MIQCWIWYDTMKNMKPLENIKFSNILFSQNIFSGLSIHVKASEVVQKYSTFVKGRRRKSVTSHGRDNIKSYESHCNASLRFDEMWDKIKVSIVTLKRLRENYVKTIVFCTKYCYTLICSRELERKFISTRIAQKNYQEFYSSFVVCVQLKKTLKIPNRGASSIFSFFDALILYS